VTVLVVGLALTLAACGGSSSSSSSSAAPPRAQSAGLSGEVAVAAFERAFPEAEAALSPEQLATTVEFATPMTWPRSETGTAAAVSLVHEWSNLFLPNGSDVRPREEVPDPRTPDGRLVRLEQVIDGIPVFGGEIQFRFEGVAPLRMSSIDSNIAPITPPAARERISEAQATQLARAELARIGTREADAPPESQLTLMIFAPSLLGLPGDNAEAYRVDIGSFHVFVHAGTGAILHLYRNVASVAPRFFECEPIMVCQAAEPPPRGKETAALKVSTTAAYDYFKSVHGLDGFAANGGGKAAGAYSRYWIDSAEYDRAARALRFSAGWVHQDVVAHEYTHGILFHISGIEYTNEAGAIHEFFADLFAAFIATGGSSPWVIGETLAIPGERVPLRDLRSPRKPGFEPTKKFHKLTNAGQPDKLSAFVRPTDEICRTMNEVQDYGCVHFNGAILSLAAVKAVDGLTPQQPGMGPTKFARIAYDAMVGLHGLPRLTRAAAALRASCTKLVKAKAFGLTTADCGILDGALRSVEL
jgi:hypothetical protein